MLVGPARPGVKVVAPVPATRWWVVAAYGRAANSPARPRRRP